MRKYLISAGTLILGSGMLLAQGTTATATNGTTGAGNSNQATSSKSGDKADKTFAMKAAQGGMAEVELGKLAADKGSNPDVKAFGQRMVDDHTKANDQLKSIASQQNIALPTEVSAKDKAEQQRLSKLSGAAFDRAYINHMVMDHKKDVAEFQKEANSGKNDAVKSFASQTLPTLQDHLKQAQDVQSKVKGSGSTNASASTPQ